MPNVLLSYRPKGDISILYVFIIELQGVPLEKSLYLNLGVPTTTHPTKHSLYLIPYQLAVSLQFLVPQNDNLIRLKWIFVIPTRFLVPRNDRKVGNKLNVAICLKRWFLQIFRASKWHFFKKVSTLGCFQFI